MLKHLPEQSFRIIQRQTSNVDGTDASSVYFDTYNGGLQSRPDLGVDGGSGSTSSAVEISGDEVERAKRTRDDVKEKSDEPI